MTVDLHPYDGLDEDSRSVASTVYNKRPKSPQYHHGSIEFYKYCYDEDLTIKDSGKTVNYQLEDFKNGLLTELSEGLAFRMDQIGYTYEWTLAEDAVQEDIEQYGKRRITFSITDDEFYLNDKIKFDDDKINETPEGTIRLGYQDFEITSISYYSDIKGAMWSEEELKFLTSSPEYDENNSLYIYAKFGANDSWQLAGIYHYIDRRGEVVSEMVKSVSDSEIIFKKNACCTGFRIVFANSFYSSLLRVYPKNMSSSPILFP